MSDGRNHSSPPSRKRLKRRSRPAPKASATPQGSSKESDDSHGAAVAHCGVFLRLREWIDPLIFAYLLAMFIRTFAVELFKIPSGSMTPTLIGDEVAEVDYDGDGEKDLIVASHFRRPDGSDTVRYQIFRREANGYDVSSPTPFAYSLPPAVAAQFAANRQTRYDRICVNKFAYWFHPAPRGDIVVFKVPRDIFTREKPIYVKRVVGLPGETVAIENNRLWVNGAPATEPPFFLGHFYSDQCGDKKFAGLRLGPGEQAMFGDNTMSSQDSRYWGAVPVDNFRGKAFFRYMPFSRMRFLG